MENNKLISFITKARIKHGDKYDYSKVEYINNHTKVCIICPEHGEFWQTPSNHLHPFEGCEACYKIKMNNKNKKDNEIFINDSKKVHGNKYDYSKVNYINNKTKICITCPNHGEFWQTPKAHLKGDGCPTCNLSFATQDDYINKACAIHNNYYDYSKVVYKNCNEKICIICPEHGEFWQRAHHHINGHGCPKCGMKRVSIKKSKTIDDFIVRANIIHENKYNYSESKYNGCKEKIKIICPIHGLFEQTVTDHLDGHGCPKCGTHISIGEDEIYNFLLNHFKENEIILRDRKILCGQELDIFIPSKKIGIEFNGIRWHSDKFKNDKNYHLSKTKMCNDKGIFLIHVYEDDFLNKKELIFDKLKNIIGVNKNKPVIGGRKCTIKNVSTKEAKTFLNENHIQGFSSSTIYLGAFYLDELIAVMSFKIENKKKKKWELTRFATNINYRTPGVASKLFKYFKDNYEFSEVKSFLDLSWFYSKNNLYTNLGFKEVKRTNPDYMYVVKNKRVHKFNFRKQILHKKYELPLTMTEKEMTETLGFHRIWNSGLIKYIYKNDTI